MENIQYEYYLDKESNTYTFIVQGEDYCICDIGYKSKNEVELAIKDIIDKEGLAW